MNEVKIAQLVGIIAFVGFMVIMTIVLAHAREWVKYGRIIAAWLIIYLWFLLLLRIFSFFTIGTREQLTIVSGFATVIPLAAILFNIFLVKREPIIEEFPMDGDRSVEIKGQLKVKK